MAIGGTRGAAGAAGDGTGREEGGEVTVGPGRGSASDVSGGSGTSSMGAAAWSGESMGAGTASLAAGAGAGPPARAAFGSAPLMKYSMMASGSPGDVGSPV